MLLRKGFAMAQILLVTAVLLTAATAVIHWQLQRHQASAKSAARTRLTIDAEGRRGTITSCLGAAGYPSGSCQPNQAQTACIPAEITVAFSGTPPNCKMDLTASR